MEPAKRKPPVSAHTTPPDFAAAEELLVQPTLQIIKKRRGFYLAIRIWTKLLRAALNTLGVEGMLHLVDDLRRTDVILGGSTPPPLGPGPHFTLGPAGHRTALHPGAIAEFNAAWHAPKGNSRETECTKNWIALNSLLPTPSFRQVRAVQISTPPAPPGSQQFKASGLRSLDLPDGVSRSSTGLTSSL